MIVMSERPHFLFVTCQVGAEKAVKGELRRRWADFRFAFSRPGFLTFKLPEDCSLPADFDLHAVFARAYGFSLGRVTGDDPDALARNAWTLFGHRPWQRIHVWQRDAAEPGAHGFEPSLTTAAMTACAAMRGNCPHPERLVSEADEQRVAVRPGQSVLDCIVLDPGNWWVGYHRAKAFPSQWPGGFSPLELPTHAISRAWLKMEEALRWAQLPIPAEAQWAEIGSAPGGSSQALLQRGYYVTGIDPAVMDPALMNHSRFTHIRRRVPQVQRRDFRKIRWLAADMNVAPNYTLDAVESIVTHPQVNIRGLLLTLKLPQWDLAAEAPEFLARIRSWGYNVVRARQLQHNRHEFCVAALQKPFHKKPSPRSAEK
jgi:23S rRNA (cytidine2498-2'-O)-methyltransferase